MKRGPVVAIIAALTAIVLAMVISPLLVIGALGEKLLGSSGPGSEWCSFDPIDDIDGIAGAIFGSWKAEQVQNAAIIIAIGSQQEVPEQGVKIALMTAMQESSLRNLDDGDRDSLGLFQQRPSMMWGSAGEVQDPVYSTRAFFGGPGGPNYSRGYPKGLLDIDRWESMGLGEAAQTVQRSAYPDAYAKWSDDADALMAYLVMGTLVDQLVNVVCDQPWTGDDGTLGGAAVRVALSAVGTPYSWGGGTFDGPSYGTGSGAHVKGFDCSSLVRWAWYQATGGKVRLTRTTGTQVGEGLEVPKEELRPGDLIYFFHGTKVYHVAMYVGDDEMVHAPHPGDHVRVVKLSTYSNQNYQIRRVVVPE